MSSHSTQRRAFLRAAGQAMQGSCIALSLPLLLTACRQAEEARLSGEPLRNLAPEQARAMEAIAARIIPSGETPGASEAGVIYFIDNVIEDINPEQRAVLDEGLAQLQEQAEAQFGNRQFHQLDAAQQDELLRAIESTPFFLTIRFLTVAGMFSLPEYGGNRDGIGYQLIGYQSQGAWVPPFGYYDADYRERGQ